MTPDQYTALSAKIDTVVANQGVQGLQLATVSGQVARLSDRVNLVEETANKALRATDTSKHEISGKDTVLASILDAQNARLESIERTGSVVSVLRELRVYAVGALLLVGDFYLVQQRVLEWREAGMLFALLAAAFLGFVAQANAERKAEAKAGATIPPPKGP